MSYNKPSTRLVKFEDIQSNNVAILNATATVSFTPQKSAMPSYLRILLTVWRGTAVAQWLRCCATNRKVAVSIPDGVIGNFH